MTLSYAVLGPLEVFDGERVVQLTRSKDRMILATLLVHANQVVSTDRLFDVLWGDRPPASGLKALQFHISGLRDLLNPGRTGAADTCLKTRSPGYVLEVAAGDVDADRFRQLVDDARDLLPHDPANARELLVASLALWRGTALADFTFAAFAAAEIQGLEEARIAALELLYTAELALDHHLEAIPTLVSLVLEHPYRERLHALLITALYRSGRQADALSVFTELRIRLREELGINPSTELVALETDVLLQSELLHQRPDAVLRGGLHATRDSGTRGNLPVYLTRFIGRTEERAHLVELVKANRLVTVTGTGGAGKTRLAIEVASTLGDGHVSRVVFVDLAAVTDAALVDQAVLVAVGAAESSSMSVRDVIVDHLVGQRVLIVLDNCEHVALASASVAGHILSRTTDVRILATSQQVLRLPGERVYPLPQMVTSAKSKDVDDLASDAAKLFLDHAQRARPGFVPSEPDAADIATIVRDLDGMPLAIELAAARVRMMTVHDVAVRLSERLRLLTDGSSLIKRHETLEAAVAWSYDLTQGRERHLFDCLSTFAGSFSHEAAAHVGEFNDPIEVIELLGRLVDKSLIQVDGSGNEMHYRLLSTLSAFGAARLLERGEHGAVADRHASHFQAMVRNGNEHLKGPEQRIWQDRFRQTAPDIRKALDWLIDNRPDDALAAVTGLGAFWWRESTYSEGMTWQRRALEAASSAPSRDRAGSLKMLAANAFWAGETDEALCISTEAVAMAREVGDTAILSAALNMVGVCAWNKGHLRDAIASFEASVDVEEQAGRPTPVAVLWNIGISYLDLADLGGADKTARRLSEVHAPEGEPLLVPQADFLKCNIAIVWGEYEEAKELAEAALTGYTDLGRVVDVAEAYERLAEINGLQGDLADLDRHLAKADELRGDMSPMHQSRANLIRARRGLAVGDLNSTRESLGLVLAVAVERQQPVMLSSIFHETSRLAFASGDPVDAALLTGTVSRIAEQPEVTLAQFVLEQARQLREDLVASLGAKGTEREIRRGALLETSDALELAHRYLTEPGSKRDSRWRSR